MNLVVTIGLSFVIIVILPVKAPAKVFSQPPPVNATEILEDPNYVDENGNTHLITLATKRENHASIMKELLDNGANVNAKNKWGRTAVYEAANIGNFDHVRILISYGADIITELETRRNILLAAIYRGKNLDVVKLLVEKGADLTGSFAFLFFNEDDRGKITNDTDQLLEIAELFIAKGVDINDYIESDVGNTALYIAAYTGNKKMVEFLVEKGANLNTKRTTGYDERGYTPILIAAKENHVEVVEYLIQAGADLAVIGDDDFNLAVWAIRGGERRGSGDSRKNIVHPNLLLDLAKKGAVNIDTPINECESDKGERVCYDDLLTWAAKHKYTEIVNHLSLTDETYYGDSDSKWQIVTSAKLTNIMEKLNEIAKALNIPEIEK